VTTGLVLPRFQGRLALLKWNHCGTGADGGGQAVSRTQMSEKSYTGNWRLPIQVSPLKG